MAANLGSIWSKNCLVGTAIGARLRYRTHCALSEKDWPGLCPAGSAAVAQWSPGTAELVATLPAAPSAVLYRLTTRGGARPLRTVVASRPAPGGPLVLGVRVDEARELRDPRSGPDTLSFGVEEPDGTFTLLATLDGKYLSTEVAGGFTSCVIGMYAATGTVHFDWFDYQLVI